MGQFILESEQNFFKFKYVDDVESDCLFSQNYTSKPAALNGITSVKNNCEDSSNYVDVTNEGETWFHLNAGNGHIIGTSEHFPDTVLGKDKKKKKKKK